MKTPDEDFRPRERGPRPYGRAPWEYPRISDRCDYTHVTPERVSHYARIPMHDLYGRVPVDPEQEYIHDYPPRFPTDNRMGMYSPRGEMYELYPPVGRNVSHDQYIRARGRGMGGYEPEMQPSPGLHPSEREVIDNPMYTPEHHHRLGSHRHSAASLNGQQTPLFNNPVLKARNTVYSSDTRHSVASAIPDNEYGSLLRSANYKSNLSSDRSSIGNLVQTRPVDGSFSKSGDSVIEKCGSSAGSNTSSLKSSSQLEDTPLYKSEKHCVNDNFSTSTTQANVAQNNPLQLAHTNNESCHHSSDRNTRPVSNPTFVRSAVTASTQVNQASAQNSSNKWSASKNLTRSERAKRFIRRSTASFFGIDDVLEEQLENQWRERRKRMADKRYGPLKDELFSRQTSIDTHERTRPSNSDVVDSGTPNFITRNHIRKESVASMTWGGLSYVISTVARRQLRKKSLHSDIPVGRSRSYAPSSVTEDSVFEEPYLPPPVPYRTDSVSDEIFFDSPGQEPKSETPRSAMASSVDQTDKSNQVDTMQSPSSRWQRQGTLYNDYVSTREDKEGGPSVGMCRIWHKMLDKAFDNSNRREYGMGVIGRLLKRRMRKSVSDKSEIRKQLDSMEDYRPYFTYWVTTVQVLIMLIALFCYGFGPVGFEVTQKSGQVLVTSLSLQEVEYWEPSSLWLGPKASDLVHLGAKFAPCMRKDAKMQKEIERARQKEKGTACCIRNDNSGCVQASEAECSETLSTWHKWHVESPSPKGRLSGSVCGLDPDFCQEPASVNPYVWPDDITRWPVCRKKRKDSSQAAEHMVCEVIGHPCCIGIHGECRITTREYCDFVHGFFHDEASLCSQVSCLDDVCGMIPFYNPNVPDQFYRLWTSLFLHAGLMHLVVTVIIQYFLMRDLEKLVGPLRMGVIYLLSGIAGNLASAIFIPYRADVGPSGSQFGLLACLFVEVIKVWPMLKCPIRALLKLCVITLALFIMGLLPWVDNYAHIGGFAVGFLLAYAFLPFVSFGPYSKRRKVILIWVCLISILILFIVLFLLFYVTPLYECKVCEYLDCLPITRDFCGDQNIYFNRRMDLI